MMKWSARLTAILVVCLFAELCFPLRANAYIDPGTGSYMFQMMIGFLVGALFAVKLFWQRMKNFLRRLVFRQEQSENDER
jgi:hypothetical protein